MGIPETVNEPPRHDEHASWSSRLAGGRRPVVIAVALAALSVPVVTVALLLAPEAAPRADLRRLAVGEAVVLAAIGTMSAAIVGGGIGGVVLHARRSLGVLTAIALAWPVGVVILPIAAQTLGIRFEALEFCLDTCNPLIRSEVPLSGAGAYMLSVVLSAMVIAPLIVALLLGFVARRLSRRREYLLESVVIVGVYASLNWIVVLGGAVTILPFLMLAIGVVAWARLVSRPR